MWSSTGTFTPNGFLLVDWGMQKYSVPTSARGSSVLAEKKWKHICLEVSRHKVYNIRLGLGTAFLIVAPALVISRF